MTQTRRRSANRILFTLWVGFLVLAMASSAALAPETTKTQPKTTISTPAAPGKLSTTPKTQVALPDVGKPGHFLLAVVRGKELREDAFTTYSTLVEMLEGVAHGEKRQRELLQDFVLQHVICDLVPQLASSVEEPDVPLPYKTLAELSLLKRSLRDKIEQETSPTREQLEAWTRENAERFMRPEQVHAFHLFMQVSKESATSSPEAVRRRMEEVKRLADGGTSFAQLARRYSEAASGRVGGDIGWISRRMPIGPEAKPMNIVLENALFALKAGEVSEIIQTSHGLHLLYCADRLTTYVPTTDELITSHILPRTAQVQLARQRWLEGIKAMREKFQAQLVYDFSRTDPVTTNVEVFKIKDTVWTMRQLEELYGPRFTGAFRLRSQSTETLRTLFNDVLDDLLAYYWAIDAGIQTDPHVARDLQSARDRARMKQILARYIAEKYPVNEETLRKAYEARKEMMRLPEGKGYIISINAQPTTVGMSRDEARAAARKKAEEVRNKILEGADIEQLAREYSQDNRATSGGLVERSVLANLSDPAGRMFGAVASWLKPGEVSEVRQFGDTFVVVRLDERWDGTVPPFEEVRQRLATAVRSENDLKARRELLQDAKRRGLVNWANPAAAYGVNPDEGF